MVHTYAYWGRCSSWPGKVEAIVRMPHFHDKLLQLFLLMVNYPNNVFCPDSSSIACTNFTISFNISLVFLLYSQPFILLPLIGLWHVSLPYWCLAFVHAKLLLMFSLIVYRLILLLVRICPLGSWRCFWWLIVRACLYPVALTHTCTLPK